MFSRRRRNRRLFLAGKKRRGRRFLFKNVLEEMFNDAKDWLKEKNDQIIQTGINFITNIQKRTMKIKNSAGIIIDYAKEKMTEFKNFIKETIQNTVKAICAKITQLKEKLNDFLNSKIVQEAKVFVECIKTAVEQTKTIVSTITNFFAQIVSLTTLAGWAKLFINWICGWESLKLAIENLKKGWNSMMANFKWDHYGKAFGYFIVATAG